MLIDVLVALIVIAILIYVVNLVIGMLGLPAEVKTIALLIIGLIALLYILSLFGVSVGSHSPLLK